MSFIKENIFIIMGVCLPLLLVGLLALLQFASKVVIEPPQYRAVYITKNYSYGFNLITDIDNNTKQLKISAKVFNNYKDRENDRTIHVYNGDNDIKSYKLDTSNISEKNKDKTVSIPVPKELKNTTFINSTTSPDGYKFEHSVYRNGNLMTELFGYGRHKRKDAIVKSGVKTHLPNTTRHPKTKFVGWIEK